MALPEAITNIPPKRLLLIAGGGIGAGLLWRHFQGRSASATPVGPDGAPIDTSQFALAQNSAGNLGAAGTQPMPSTNDATRDFGSAFPLPISTGVTQGSDGVWYYVDATGRILGPVGGTAGPAGNVNPPLSTNPDPTLPTVATLPSANDAAAKKAENEAAVRAFYNSQVAKYAGTTTRWADTHYLGYNTAGTLTILTTSIGGPRPRAA